MKYKIALALLTCCGIISAQDGPLPNSVVTVKGFKIELKQCQKPSSKVITCSVVVTNKEADRIVALPTYGSYFVDAGGMQVSSNGVKLGTSVGGNGCCSPAQTEVVTDVSVKGTLDFTVGDPQATSIAKLSVGFDSGGAFRVDFRKIPIE